MPSVTKLDDLDKGILDFLQEDSRLSYRQIASVLGASVSTVSERVRNCSISVLVKVKCLEEHHG